MALTDNAPRRAATSGTTVGRPLHKVSLRTALVSLVVTCLLPGMLFSGYLIYAEYQYRRDAVFSESRLLARKVSADLDREFSAIESGLKILATSRSLAIGDLQGFYLQARGAVKTQIVYNYVLLDRRGRQVMNTAVPFGQPLPDRGTPEELAAVFTEGRTVLADLFMGPVVRKLAIAMAVPVYRDGEIIYSLAIGLDPAELQKLIERERVPPDWLLVILDKSATIVARSRAAQQFVGTRAVPALAEAMLKQPEATLETETKEGIPAVSSHYRSELWGWTVAVGVHRSLLLTELRKDMLVLSLAGLGVLLSTLAVALVIKNRLMTHLAALNRSAVAVSEGRGVVSSEVRFVEFDAVHDALVNADQAMRRIQHLAYHDPLTGLPNRPLFQEVAGKLLAAARRSGSAVAVMVVDIDDFKKVNDTQGHEAGDRLLQEIAARLRANTREEDAAARMGGDEFLVVSRCRDAEDALELGGRLVEALAQPYAGIETHVSASVGLAIFPGDGDHIDQLLNAADRALYVAKRAGKNRAQLALPQVA